MSHTPSDPLAGIDLSGKLYLSPDAVVTVARNVAKIEMAPMSEQLRYLVRGFQKLFGDPEDSDIPAEFRSKGVLLEMREEQVAFRNEQRDWKASDDLAKANAQRERAALAASDVELDAKLEKLRVDFEAEKRHAHKMRWLFAFFVRWIVTKDDPLTIAILKVAGLMTAGTALMTGAVASGIGLAHGVGILMHMLFHHGK